MGGGGWGLDLEADHVLHKYMRRRLLHFTQLIHHRQEGPRSPVVRVAPQTSQHGNKEGEEEEEEEKIKQGMIRHVFDGKYDDDDDDDDCVVWVWGEGCVECSPTRV